MFEVTYGKHDAFVERLREQGVNVEWDGWSMLFLSPDRSAERSQYGSYQNGQWGYASRIEAGSNGRWSVPGKFTKGLHGAAV